MQIYGSGTGGYTNTALVTDTGELLVNVPGSINTYGTVSISGGIHIGSVSANVDAIYIQSGANVDLGSAWTNIGSVLIYNPVVIGSLSIQSITGSINIINMYQGSEIFNRVAGSVVNWPGSLAISNFAALGSNVIISNFGDLGSQRTISAGSFYVVSSP